MQHSSAPDGDHCLNRRGSGYSRHANGVHRRIAVCYLVKSWASGFEMVDMSVCESSVMSEAPLGRSRNLRMVKSSPMRHFCFPLVTARAAEAAEKKVIELLSPAVYSGCPEKASHRNSRQKAPCAR